MSIVINIIGQKPELERTPLNSVKPLSPEIKRKSDGGKVGSDLKQPGCVQEMDIKHIRLYWDGCGWVAHTTKQCRPNCCLLHSYLNPNATRWPLRNSDHIGNELFPMKWTLRKDGTASVCARDSHLHLWSELIIGWLSTRLCCPCHLKWLQA